MENNKNNDKKKEEVIATSQLLDIIRNGKNSNSESAAILSPEKNKKEEIENNKPIPAIKPSKKPIKSSKPFFSRLGFFKNKRKMILGLDIGSQTIKFVQLKKIFNAYRLIDYGVKEIVQNSTTEDTFEDVQNLIQHIDLSKVAVVTSVGGSSVIVRHIQFPHMTEEELAQSLKWEAKTYIPFPLNEVTLDYQIIGPKHKVKKLNVLLVAVTKKHLQNHLDLMHKLSINPKIVDIKSLALINSYLAKDRGKHASSITILDIGTNSTILTIYRPGGLYFTKEIHIGGNSFTKQIKSHLTISYEEAEEFKRKGEDNTIKLYDIIKPSFDVFIGELRRCLIYYDNQTGRKGFSKLIITGGGARLKNIDNYISEELGIPVEHLDPFNSIYVNKKIFPEEILSQDKFHMGICMGLAMRG
ncbi:MAG: type IV pilus assembly protein PilM [bacterium]